MYNNYIIQDAIANMAHTSKVIEAYGKDEANLCSQYASDMLRRFAIELQKLTDELEEINYLHVS